MMIVIRKLLPFERRAYEAHLLRLSATDRSMRFSGGVGRSGIRGYIVGLDRRCTVVLGAFVGGVLRGALDLTRVDGNRSGTGLAVAEISVSVEGPWQDRGIATALLRRALRVARNRGIGQVRGVWLNDNHRIARVFEKLGGRSRAVEGMVQGEIELKPRDWRSIAAETAIGGVGLFGTFAGRLHVRRTSSTVAAG